MSGRRAAGSGRRHGCMPPCRRRRPASPSRRGRCGRGSGAPRRAQPVLGQDLAQRHSTPMPGIDDEALLPRAGREDVAVGAEGGGREPDGQHAPSLTAGRLPRLTAATFATRPAPVPARRRARRQGAGNVTKEQERARARRRQQKLDAREAQRAREASATARSSSSWPSCSRWSALFVFLSSQLGDDQAEPAAASTASASAPASGADRLRQLLPRADRPRRRSRPVDDARQGHGGRQDVRGRHHDQLRRHHPRARRRRRHPRPWPRSSRSPRPATGPTHPATALTTEGIFVLQCGDPLGGTGPGPGYTFGIENAPAGRQLPQGHARHGPHRRTPTATAASSSSSTRTPQLPTEGGGYSIFGTVTDGMDIVEKIAAAGVSGGANDGAPADAHQHPQGCCDREEGLT